jgi:hypothetical protein
MNFLLPPPQVREDPVFRREGSNIHVDAVLGITQVKTFFFHGCRKTLRF